MCWKIKEMNEEKLTNTKLEMNIEEIKVMNLLIKKNIDKHQKFGVKNREKHKENKGKLEAR